MKSWTLALLSGLFIAAQAAPPAAGGDVSWYDPIRNASCTGHADGSIRCQLGQTEAGPKSNVATPNNAHRLEPQAGAARPLGLDLQPTVLESRADNKCSGDGPAKALGCFLNCFSQGFCSARCDPGDVCQCGCKDGAAKGEAPCGKKSC